MSVTVAVLNEYLSGSRTVSEINAITGMDGQKISKATYKLIKRGLIVRTGNAGGKRGEGGMPGFYEPVKEMNNGRL